MTSSSRSDARAGKKYKKITHANHKMFFPPPLGTGFFNSRLALGRRRRPAEKPCIRVGLREYVLWISPTRQPPVASFVLVHVNASTTMRVMPNKSCQFFFPSPTPKQSSQVFDYTRVFDRRGEGMTRRKNVPVGNTILERRTRLMTVAWHFSTLPEAGRRTRQRVMCHPLSSFQHASSRT